MKKLRLAILQNEVENDHALWVRACQERQDLIGWSVVDITRADWLTGVDWSHFDGVLATPPAFTMPFKVLFDERINILHTAFGLPVYPSLNEILVYENKKYLSYWLQAHQIPHPTTWVFYHEKEALDFLATAKIPVVGKTNIGASGRGISILKSKAEAIEYVKNTFSGKGVARDLTPKWRRKGFVKRVMKKLLRPSELRAKLQQYQSQRADVQKDFVIFQEFIPHSFEWRCVRIGDSFFAHKKIVKGEKASGSLIKGYDNPPLSLMDFLREVTEPYHFWSQAVDIFETQDGEYLVNEMQCIFGQSDPYQMLVDGEPGRYVYADGEWIFEAGDFNRHESFLLRVDHFIDILTKQPKRLQHESTVRM